jgi:hypothetical protein
MKVVKKGNICNEFKTFNIKIELQFCHAEHLILRGENAVFGKYECHTERSRSATLKYNINFATLSEVEVQFQKKK